MLLYGFLKTQSVTANLWFSMREAVTIGKQIRKYRRAKDITQEQLAEKIGVSLAWIGRVERGSTFPTVQLLIRIAQVLRVKVNDLIPF